MTKSLKFLGLPTVALAAMLLAGGCGASSSSAGSGKTVSVDVGTGTPVKLTTGKLKVALLMNAVTNEWQKNFVASAKKTAKAHDIDLTVMDANYDAAAQRSELQNAATSHAYDALLVQALDGVQSCDLLTKTLPKANVLVSIIAGQVCGRTDKAGDENWAPGTLNFVGGDSTIAYQQAWVKTAAKMNPGPQKVAVVMGPQLSPYTATETKVVKAYEQENPNFKVEGLIYTDFTTPSGYKASLAYLQAHPDISLIMSVYSPDLTRGVVQALSALHKAGKIPIGDMGGSSYSVEQIKAGTVQFTLPYTPVTEAKNTVESIVKAQSGEKPTRFVEEFPAGLGSSSDPFVVTAKNVGSYKPEF